MPRYVFGPSIGRVSLVVTPEPTPSIKLDVEVAFAGNTPEGLFKFAVPAHDLATHNQLDAIHVGLYEVGAAIPANPGDVLNHPHVYSAAATPAGGETVTVDAMAAPAGDWDVLAVLEFAS
jgi:hypothetical protein